jgi:thiosulfate dehydrogenase (quinone) large subunit
MSAVQAPRSPVDAEGWEGRLSPLGLTAIRIVLGVTFLHEAAWKRPPDFGLESGRGLWEWSNFAVDFPVFAPYSWFVEHVVQPNFVFFGWVTFFLEAGIGAFLILGLLTRLTAVAGVVQSFAITFSVLNQDVFSEWSYAYYIMIAAFLAVLGSAAGRFYGLDAVLRPLWARSDGKVARLLLRAS